MVASVIVVTLANWRVLFLLFFILNTVYHIQQMFTQLLYYYETSFVFLVDGRTLALSNPRDRGCRHSRAVKKELPLVFTYLVALNSTYCR